MGTNHTDRGLSSDVIETVAALEGVPQDRLPAMYNAVESDALEKLIEHASTHATPVTVQFEYGGYHVSVSEGGQIHVVESTS